MVKIQYNFIIERVLNSIPKINRNTVGYIDNIDPLMSINEKDYKELEGKSNINI